MAPFTPFLAEELYIKLTGDESVHLRDWPKGGHINELSLDRMSYVRELINEGLSQRAAAGIKVRQPLQKLSVKGAPKFFDDIEQDYLTILQEELNVKAVWTDTHDVTQEVRLDIAMTPELRREGKVREVIRNVQNARKQAGLEVDDRIKLSFSTEDSELKEAITEQHTMIVSEALAESLQSEQSYDFEVVCSIDGASITISLERA